MTDANGKQIPRRTWFLERLWTKAMDWLLLAVFGAIVAVVFEPVRDRAVAIWDSPQALGQIDAKIDTISARQAALAADVRRLKQPEAVFEMSTFNTAPVRGYCVEGQPCQIRVRLRRLEAALSCRIVRGSIQWGFINPRSDSFVGARRLDQPSGRNMGPTWEDVEITLMTPTGLEPEADFTFEAFYTNCPGTEPDEDPISFNSPRDRFTIFPTQAAADAARSNP
ncbi:hypothetical protein KM176_16445 [Pseudooceanicola sp. CBS1P-1]|uniref:Uncharacterized protein n=1 Tax=Pseudooceanicola albus TaxID=2692189 RepID=A0A6L7G8V8_9RHOB|nr:MULTISPECIES: hypothetical protein [Pseudooceanicola]MBT9385465.1 hypothetical protein [Pseudooceanicola endophyticus]MXN19123.1 hypothetical protein [Pseudooceanicola albus]